MSENPTPQTAQAVSGADLVKPLVEGMPKVSEGVALSAPAPAADNSAAPMLDKKGRPFDPSKHASPPRLNSQGYFIGKGGGRPSTKTPAAAPEAAKPAPAPAPAPAEDRGSSVVNGGESPGPVAPGSATASEGAPSATEDEKIRLTAEGLVRAFYGVAGGLTGGFEEWQPDNAAEHNALVESTITYMKATGKTELPPGVALSLQVGAYSAIRLGRPKTSAWLTPKWEWLKQKLGLSKS